MSKNTASKSQSAVALPQSGPCLPPVLRRKSWLRSSCAPKALLAIPAALSLGIALARPAHAGTTINTNKTSTVNLQNSTNYPGGNPFSVTNGTDVTVTGGNAIYGDSTGFWTLTNAGTVTATGPLHNGVFFKNGGNFTDTGTVSSGYGGVLMSGSTVGTVTNSGTITGTNFGINLEAGGTVNSTSGSIGGGTVGVEIGSIAGTLFNGGTITETNGGSGYAAVQLQGGYVKNSGTITGASSGIISSGTNSLEVLNSNTIGGVSFGVNLGTVAGTLFNTGKITQSGTGATLAAIELSGGYISNATLDSIIGFANGIISHGTNALTVNNAGQIQGIGQVFPNQNAAGIILGSGGGAITNSASNASILGNFNSAIVSDYGTFSVFNAGDISSNEDGIVSTAKTLSSLGLYGTVSVTNTIGGFIGGNENGIVINTGAATIFNQGTIQTEFNYGENGIYLGAGGTITNATSNNPNGFIGGNYDGIRAKNTFVAITNSGSIIGLHNDGVDLLAGGAVFNNNWGTLNIGGSGAIGGYVDGVHISGAQGTVFNVGSIIGVSLNGVELHNGGTVFNGGTINGGYSGVHIGYGFNGPQNAAGSVFNSGVILGTAQAGVILFSGGSVDNQGLIKAIGTSADGISMYTSNAFVFNGTDATVNGGRVGDGVRLNNGGTVTNHGTIKTGIDGVRGTGIYMYNGGFVANLGSAALVEGLYGVQSKGDGQGTVYNTGLVQGYRSGVDLLSGGTVVNDNSSCCSSSYTGIGTITGNQKGIHIAGTYGVVFNYGLIHGGSIGVDMQAGGSLVNSASYITSGVITGGTIGVRITGGYAIVNNNGYDGDIQTISGGSIGVQLAAFGYNLVQNQAGQIITGGSTGVQIGFSGGYRNRNNYNVFGTVNNDGFISGGYVGVAFYGFGRGGSGSLENSGTIAATGTDGIGVYLLDGGIVHNNGTSAVITGGQFGIDSESNYSRASVTNEGTIQGGEFGVALFGGGYVSNASAATISGDIGVQIGYDHNSRTSSGVVLNSGTIIGGQAGVALFSGGSISNSTTGTISGEANGIFGGTVGSVSVVNNGHIYATTFAVNLYSSANVTNTGTIIGGSQGVYIGGTYATNAYVTNSSTGTIIGSNDQGVDLEAANNTAVNSGYIGSGGAGVNISSTYATTGIVLNTGSIHGGDTGVYVGGSYVVTAYVSNGSTGTITASGDTGVYLDGINNTLVNRGSIHGGKYGVYVGSSYSTTAFVTNSSTGTITGGKIGVDVNAPTDSIVNSGLITGGVYGGVRADGSTLVSVINQQTGTITGFQDGVDAGGGTITNVFNSGTITGLTDGGLDTSGNSSHTTISNTSTGVITGAHDGVYDESAYFTLDNIGLIHGGGTYSGVLAYEEYVASITNEANATITGYDAVENDENATFSLNNGGLISGTDAGVYTHGGGTIVNITNLDGGTITGADYGIYNTNAQLSVDNSGLISGASADGIYTSGTVDTVINEQTATITGYDGIVSDSATFSLDNAGHITSTGNNEDANAGVYTETTIASVFNEATGTISGVTSGVWDDSYHFSLTNHGLINSASYGVYLEYGNNVTNFGTIIGGRYGIYTGNQNPATIDNSGTIIGSSDNGVFLQTGTLTNEASGVITGGTIGVAVGDSAAVTNAGLILDDPAPTHAGVLLYGSAATLINLSTGTISGATGVTITGNDDSVFNAGTIIGTGGTAIQIADFVDPTHITLTTGSTLFGDIDGGGTDGQITLTGTNIMGNDIVNFGTGSALSIVPGADWTASGNWTIASVTNSGTFQPGIIGTPLNLTGDFVQGSMGTLRVVVTPSEISQFNVTGTATVGGKLTYVFAPGYYQPTTLDFLTAGGGVNADNLTVTYLGYVPPYLSHDTFIIASGTIPSNLVLGYVAPLDDTIFSDMNQEAATEALAANDSLLGKAGEGDGSNPEACAAAEGVNKAGNAPGSTAGQMATALGNAFCSAGGWIQATGEAANQNASGGAPSFNAAGGGFLAGIDKPVSSSGTRVGLAVGYDTTWLHDSAGGKGSIDTTRVGLYGSQPIGSFTLAADFLYGFASNTSTRQTGIGGLGAKYNGNIYSGGVQLSTDIPVDGFNIEPSAGARFASVHTDSLSEGATGVLAAFAVKGAATSYTSIQPFVNVGLSHSFLTGSAIIVTPEASVGYSLQAGDRGKAVDLTIADGTTYTSGHNNPDSSAAQISAGVSAGKNNWSLYARYSAYVSGNWTAQTGEAGLEVRF